MAIAAVEKLTVQLSRLPGIGRKTAQRLCFFLLGVPREQADELADAIRDARDLRAIVTCRGKPCAQWTNTKTGKSQRAPPEQGR